MNTETPTTPNSGQQLNEATKAELPRHAMIDIETMGVNADSVILSIGACSIRNGPDERLWPVKTFYVELDPAQPNRRIDTSTLQWWLTQVDGGKACPAFGSINLLQGLLGLRNWIGKELAEDPIIWCKGTDFDTVILKHAMESLAVPLPWKYNRVRDCRTVFKLLPPELNVYPGNTNPHNALADAVFQAGELEHIAHSRGFLLA